MNLLTNIKELYYNHVLIC